MLAGALSFAGVFFTIGVFLWCKNAIKRKDYNKYENDF